MFESTQQKQIHDNEESRVTSVCDYSEAQSIASAVYTIMTQQEQVSEDLLNSDEYDQEGASAENPKNVPANCDTKSQLQ